MKILRHCYKTAQSLVSILSCPAVNCLADTLAQSLVTIDASLLANFSTWANDRDVGQHVEEDLGAAIGCRRVICDINIVKQSKYRKFILSIPHLNFLQD